MRATSMITDTQEQLDDEDPLPGTMTDVVLGEWQGSRSQPGACPREQSASSPWVRNLRALLFFVRVITREVSALFG